ncbi:unnamed protein product [Amoebophrya sp. A120]|nr:unnamed protein product [Amoebophrya sp. A120]|eukprot:GSA120T00003389001.1
MAVPYVAKDTAADRTEFAHPDALLLLTVAHYYQEGLAVGELRQVFEKLQGLGESEGAQTYSKWVERLRDADTRNFLKYPQLKAVNLEDATDFHTCLYPAFRRSMDAIDFFLKFLVFPTQAVQYKTKLTASAPDLCKTTAMGVAGITQGFSGTDDAITPCCIEQRNIASLCDTKGLQVMSFRRPENDERITVRQGGGAHEILDILGERSDITVVLDPGALVLELSNLDFVKAWAARQKAARAAVFFGADNEAMVWIRATEEVLPLRLSSFATDLRACLVYFDDVMTRGTDLPLPVDARAVLTLGRGMLKDKLLQSSGRLRGLGRGQSVLNVAAYEVGQQLDALELEIFGSATGKAGTEGRAIAGLSAEQIVDKEKQSRQKISIFEQVELIAPLSAEQRQQKKEMERELEELQTATASRNVRELTQEEKDVAQVTVVILWALRNTVEDIAAQLPLAVNQCRRSVKKNQARLQYLQSPPGGSLLDEQESKAQIEDSAVVAIPPDEAALAKYGEACVEQEPVELLAQYGYKRECRALLDTTKDALRQWNSDEFANAMIRRVEQLAPDLTRFASTLDCTQERELEQELEEERDCARITELVPASAAIPEELRAFAQKVNLGEPIPQDQTDFLLPLQTFVDNLELAKPLQLHTTSTFVTEGFANTLKSTGAKSYGVLKSVDFVVRFKTAEDAEALLIVSNQEAEQVFTSTDGKISPFLRVFTPQTTRNQTADAVVSRKAVGKLLLDHELSNQLLRKPKDYTFQELELRDCPHLHVLGCSLFPNTGLQQCIMRYFALCPRKVKKTLFEDLAEKHLVEADGFTKVEGEGRKRAGCEISRYQVSPVPALVGLFEDFRNLGTELASSTMGDVLGK